LLLDANYVRRSDAEIFWKDPAAMANEKQAASGFVIRSLGNADAAAVTEILREAREAASWSEEALRGTVELHGVSAYVSERGGTISGIVIGRRVLDEAEVLNLAVRESDRRQGEGRALVKRLLEKFTEQGVTRVFLEVRESNARAIAFYGGLGFLAVGARKDYYQAPNEAASVMELWLRKSTD
jgi:ribosomal-protein-alanine N-acetyltransferase